MTETSDPTKNFERQTKKQRKLNHRNA